jgi:t-SNARE complex subunit (syntaxin)
MTVNSIEKQVTSAQATMGTRVRNFLIAMVAIALSVALVLGLRKEWALPIHHLG